MKIYPSWKYTSEEGFIPRDSPNPVRITLVQAVPEKPQTLANGVEARSVSYPAPGSSCALAVIEVLIALCLALAVALPLIGALSALLQ